MHRVRHRPPSGPAAATRIAIATALVVGLALGSFVRASSETRAPDVPLHLADGTVVRSADYKGQVILLDFWATWCPPCKASFPALDALYRRYQGRGLQVLAINVDEDRKAVDAFLGAHPHDMPVVFDPHGTAPAAFAVKGMPSSVIVDRAGLIRFRHTGYSAKVLDRYHEEIDLLLSEHP